MKNQSVEAYQAAEIATYPGESIFAERFTLQDLYVPLAAKPVTPAGKVDESATTFDLEGWVKEALQKSSQQEQVLLIQATTGRGKSTFCKLFANWVRQHWYPAWTPIVIQLSNLQSIGSNFETTLRSGLDWEFAKDEHWLAKADSRFLFLLDGLDELPFAANGELLRALLQQIGEFQQFCSENRQESHRVLLTSRTAVLQNLARWLPSNLERVEIVPMEAEAQTEWFSRWRSLVGSEPALALQQFLQERCPETLQKLATEPLLLYLLAALHRDNPVQIEQNLEQFASASPARATALLYEQSWQWSLQQAEHWFSPNTKPTGTIEPVLSEAGLWAVQLGKASIPLAAVQQRLQPEGSTRDWLQLLQHSQTELRSTWVKLHPSSAALAATSIQLGHRSFGEFLYFQRTQQSLQNWGEQAEGESLFVSNQQMDWELYDLLGFGPLLPEIVEQLLATLEASSELAIEILFRRLENFYFRWCEGEFIDAETLEQNLAHRKMRQLKMQKLVIGQRQVDLYAGLNSFILLLELHRYAQAQDQLREKIFFYPCGRQNLNFDPARVLRLIGYSHCIEPQAFVHTVGSYLQGIYLNRADLRGVNFIGLDLSQADLSSADLSSANLIGANLTGTSLIGANLSNANLSDAELAQANLWGANLRGASLRGASLSQADLSGVDLGNSYLIRTSFRGADLSDVNLSGAVLWGVVLSGANLNGANLIRASLNGANISGASLSGANLSGSSFRSANLTGVNLCNTDLFQVNLSGANLAGIIWDDETKWEGAKGLELARNVPEALQGQLSNGG
ncbi:pentapeptide repeat-containing protein [Leptolyngbya sp. FACHB-261]|uniref:pentapeptide repeat-containing protein n=1 Tax=Leptolyngbya sp. FACHB-261 TaxID=2692806 RepID=UPI00168A01E8|nr:pentapeptide repeat-containing protein [Leptolyngbya sp. FACHB-261]MBD2100479.1 pentapeptide repeat-containing protein [Leptolyngbya sp. FACHB-261]